MELRQRRLFKTNTFILEQNHLYYKTKNLFTSFETEYPYENLITKRTVRQREPNYWLLVIFSILLLGAVAEWVNYFDNSSEKESLGVNIWFTTVVIVFGLLFYISSKLNVLIKTTSEKYLFFFADSPGKERVNEFIAALREAQKAFLLNKYFFDTGRAYDSRFNSLEWLRDIEIIITTEFEELKQKLNTEIRNSTYPGQLN
jgi:hypothetical protein